MMVEHVMKLMIVLCLLLGGCAPRPPVLGPPTASGACKRGCLCKGRCISCQWDCATGDRKLTAPRPTPVRVRGLWLGEGGEKGYDRGEGGGRPDWRRALSIEIGPMWQVRDLEFSDPVKPKNPSGYKSRGEAEEVGFELGLQVYPLAFFQHGPLTGLGLTFDFSRQDERDGVALSQHFALGLRYRWNVLGRVTSPTLSAGLGYGRRIFKFDQRYFPPDVAYDYIELTLLDADLPLLSVTRRKGRSTIVYFQVGLLTGFDYLGVASTGKIGTEDSGGYGSSSTHGLEFQVGGYLRFWDLRLSVVHRGTLVSFDFDNACYPISGCNAAAGAQDLYQTTALTLGYEL